MKNKSSLDSFNSAPYYSIKHNNYFEIYDLLFRKFIGSEVVFVEIGILDGGSLFMWRDYFGPKARIIGIDLNPAALKWVSHGFEIFIGDQSEPLFWEQFYTKVGDIDVLLDDGGHMNNQQIMTTISSISRIKNGGLVVIEDTQTSFMKFDSFKSYSFINFAKVKINSLYSRFHELNIEKELFNERVHSIEFFSGITVFHINRVLCGSISRVENKGIKLNASDFDIIRRFINFLFA